MSWTVLAVIAGSLCFSVGEGLRLTPFPVSSLTETAETNLKKSITQYGPLDVPAQPQKRSKRQVLDLAVPGAANARELITSFCYLYEFEAVDVASVPFVPRPDGRAPPFLS